MKIGLYVFDEMELLDFAGPYEVFTTAARVHARAHAGVPPLFEVCVLGEDVSVVTARAGLRVTPDLALCDAPELDCLIVPGGVVIAQLECPPLIVAIARHAATGRLTASVCTGAFLLARAGLLDGREATTHWEDIADLRNMFPAVRVREQVRWVDAGPVVTSAGISAGIDMSLHLVARMAGVELAARTARQMEFDWQDG